jgi:hypothetical protein
VNEGWNPLVGRPENENTEGVATGVEVAGCCEAAFAGGVAKLNDGFEFPSAALTEGALKVELGVGAKGLMFLGAEAESFMLAGVALKGLKLLKRAAGGFVLPVRPP